MSKIAHSSLAKNTAILYFRMLFQMVVYLYTSRVIVSTLGLNDWGVYDVVAGIIVVVTFLNNSMTVCSQRYLTYAIGLNKPEYLNNVFSTSLIIHVSLAILIIIAGETLGLFYINNYINIPSNRLEAGIFVFHCSLISTAIMVATVPYNALIIAFEKMSAFAFVSIADVTLKLIISIGIAYVSVDRLKLYALLLLIEMIIIRCIYIIYRKNRFSNISFKKQPINFTSKNRANREQDCSIDLYKEMLAFSSWSILGNLSVVCNTQGLNLLLNFVGGTLLNAARAISFQVQTAITAFVASFQTAINPRITKSYASGDIETMLKLIFASSRISFMLIIIIALPLLIETEFILKMWLNEIPDNAVAFTQLFIIIAIIDSIANPLTIAASATGKIKKYHLYIGSILLMVLPIATLVMQFQKITELIFIIQILFVIIAQIVRIQLCHTLIGLNRKKYLIEVIGKVALVTIISCMIPIALKSYLSNTLLHSMIIILVTILSTSFCIWYFGLLPSERLLLSKKILQILKMNKDEINDI